MRLLIVALALLVLHPAASCAAALPDDALLDKPVTLSLKGEALSDLFALLEAQTGARLRASRDAADQKVTIFVDEMPLKDVMRGISETLDFTWGWKTLEGNKAYTLRDDTKARRLELFQKAVMKSWEELDKELDEKARAAESGSDKSLEASFSRLYGRFPPDILKAFRAGMHIRYDSATSEDEWKLPEDVKNQLIERVKGEHLDLDVLNVNVDLAASASARQVQVEGTAVVYVKGGSTGSRSPFGYRSIVREMPQVKGNLPETTLDDMLGKKVKFAAEELAREADVRGQTDKNPGIWINSSDLWALLHKKIGMQIISDHYSQWNEWPARLPQPSHAQPT